MNTIKKTLFTITLISSTVFGQIPKISSNSTIGYKLIKQLEARYSDITTAQLSPQELNKELQELQNMVSYLSQCISLKKGSLKKKALFVTGCSIVSLYALFKSIRFNNENVAIFGNDTTYNKLIVSLTGITSVAAIGLTFITLANYYIVQLLTDDLTEQEQEKLAQDFNLLLEKISLNLANIK